MSELPGFPMVSQLDLWDTTDGRSSESAQMNCVPASIAAGLEYFNGIHYSPDALKDVAYGEGWVNQPTSIERFIPYCLTAGVTLRRVPAVSYYASVALAHTVLARGNPVIFTQQDDYAPKEPTWTHVCVWYKDTSETLTAMDPYGGKSLTFDNLTWAARMRSRDLWVMEKVTPPAPEESMQQFIDVSGFQPTIDWRAYKQWSSVAAMKATEGVGFTDPTFVAHRGGAIAAGIGTILYYHFARPDLGNAPEAEADWMHQAVGAIRPEDLLVLDFEVSPPQATADWASRFLARLEQIAGRRPCLYASTSYIQARLQDSRLARYPLWLANWTFNAAARPPCPPPWTAYLALQYTDKATSVPGVPGPVDANIFLGGPIHVDALTRYNENGHLKQELDDCWKSLIPLLPTGSGIWKSWVALWLDRGIQAGPPLKGEYSTVNGNGEVIKVLECAHLRCEWDTHSVARWYGASPGAI